MMDSANDRRSGTRRTQRFRLGSIFKRRRAKRHTVRRAMQDLINGHRNTAMLYVAAKLGVADLLANGPQGTEELAQSFGAHGPSLHRLLRGLVAMGVCLEDHDGRFGLTSLGTFLQADRPGSLRGDAVLCGEESAGAWGGLLHSAMTGHTAFNHVFGMSQWERRAQQPEQSEHFIARIDQGTAQAAGEIMATYDFSPFRTILDVGGGRGALLVAILKANPAANGILFDQQHVVAGSQPNLAAAEVEARCQVIEGDFFERVPDGADAHILKSIIHDWDDQRSLAILKNCRQALADDGRLILIDRVMPARVEDDPDVVMEDVHMLAITGGRERTEVEYRALFLEAGFKLTQIVATRSWHRVIEGVPTSH